MTAVLYRSPPVPGRTEKLTAGDVIEIRARWAKGGLRSTQGEIAADYGVTPVTISNVVNRQTWRHVRP